MPGSNHRRTAADDSFVPVNPFLQRSSRSHERNQTNDTTLENAYIFVFDILRLIYLNLLLWLPSMYFSRVAKIFQDTGFSWERMINPYEWTPSLPALVHFKQSWEAFIVSLIREWEVLSVTSGVLIAAIFAMFQISSAQENLFTRTAASLSLICAIMSLTYGCVYSITFGAMRSMYWASKWAGEVHKTDTRVWWNMYILLAMPLVWISWSMIFFVFSVLSFLLHAGSVLDPAHRPSPSAHPALGARIIITVIFSVGVLYFVMIVKTLRSYGIHTAGMEIEGATQEPQIQA